MTIALHTYNTPNGRKISVALEEMGLPYEVHVVDITKNEQFNPDFLAFAPNNRIPAIRDPDGPDGREITVFESGAILVYLAEKTGRFLPRELRGRTTVMEWLMWQMGGFGPMPGQVHHFLMQPEGPARDYGFTRYHNETKRLYGVLDRRLAGRDFVATAGEPSIADFAILGWAWRHERHQVPFDDLPNVAAWYARMMARPAVARGFEVPMSR
jgi:GST-like protein